MTYDPYVDWTEEEWASGNVGWKTGGEKDPLSPFMRDQDDMDKDEDILCLNQGWEPVKFDNAESIT